MSDIEIEALRIQAQEAGDDELVELCNKALAGDHEARAEAREAKVIDWDRFE